MLPLLILVEAAVLFLVQAVLRRNYPWLAWGVFGGLTLLLTPQWIGTHLSGEFPFVDCFAWVKQYTIQFCVCWVAALRFTSLGQHPWALRATVLLLPINILEAVVEDFGRDHEAHWLVAISGVLLIVGIPNPERSLVLGSDSRREVSYEGVTRGWILEYTLWNWAFVFLNFPMLAAHHLAVLGVPLWIGMREPRRWLLTRTYTLATHLLLMFTFPRLLVPTMDTTYWTTPQRESMVSALCLISMSSFVLRCVIRWQRPSPTHQHRPA